MLEAMQGDNTTTTGPNVQNLVYLGAGLFSQLPVVAEGFPEVDIWSGSCPLAHIEDSMNKSLKAFNWGQ